MTGGTGKASIDSPAKLVVEDGQATVTLVWSSKNYDYMVFEGKEYTNENVGGYSTFTICLGDVSILDGPITVIGDTTAMSVPHEIEYELTFN